MKKLFIFFITTLILQCFIPVWGQSHKCQCSLLSDKNTVCKTSLRGNSYKFSFVVDSSYYTYGAQNEAVDGFIGECG